MEYCVRLVALYVSTIWMYAIDISAWPLRGDWSAFMNKRLTPRAKSISNPFFTSALRFMLFEYIFPYLQLGAHHLILWVRESETG